MYVDFHSHLLPKADHGSDSLEMSLSQIKYAAKAGVDTIVATPHFYVDSDSISSFLKRRDKAYNVLVESGTQGIKIVKGAEVQLFFEIEKMDGLEKLCIDGTNYILLEFPPEPWQDWMCNAVVEIQRTRNLRPICAHIDRYSKIGRKKILKLNVEVQINAIAFLTSRSERNQYIDLIYEDSIHLIGSDAHGDGKAPYKDFIAATKKIKDVMIPITENARKILATGEKI